MPPTTLRAFHWSSIGCCHPLAIHPLESMSAIIADESTESSKHKRYDLLVVFKKILLPYKRNGILLSDAQPTNNDLLNHSLFRALRRTNFYFSSSDKVELSISLDKRVSFLSFQLPPTFAKLSMN